MSFLSPPKPQKPPEDPINNQYAMEQAMNEERLRQQGGAASTIFTSPMGDTSTAPVASKVLLGS